MRRAGLFMLLLLSITTSARATGDHDHRARMLGVLTYTPLTVRFDDVPAREALAAFSRAIALPVIGRFADDRDPNGIDPDLPISLRLEGATALYVLEAIIDQCEGLDPCTWQMRTGFIEVGTKERLSVPAASEMRLYPIRDLMIEPPYFESRDLAPFGGSPPPLPDFDTLPYATAALTRPFESTVKEDRKEDRKRPEDLAREIIHGIVELVEPGNWDYGQFDEVDEESAPRATNAPRASRRDARPQHASPTGDKIARLRFLGESIMVHAPDYIHRQIATPPAAPPRPLTEQERVDRSAVASAPGATIVLLPVSPPAEPGRRR